jgi:Ca2+-binding EF-hand superfamily protein
MTGLRMIGAVLVAAACLATAAQDTGVQSAKREKSIAAGEAEAKQMLVLMDSDRNGKVSRQEFMAFMQAEFDRLDVNKDGELDVKELTQARVVPRTGVHR